MARVSFGGGVSDIRGSIAGNVFSKNASGSYIRNKTKPTNPRTEAQSLVRAAFGTIAAAWRALTGAQRLSFVEQSPAYPYTNSLGQTKTYTGQQLHQKHNLNLQSVGAGFITSQVAPIPVDAAGAGVDTIDQSTPQILLSGLSATAADEAILVEATPPLSPGITNMGGFYKSVQIKPAGGIVDDFDLTAAYAAVYGNGWTLAGNTGNQIGFRFSKVNTTTGQAAPYGYVVGTITA